MEIQLLDYTPNARDLLIFIKQTRRMDSDCSLQEISRLSEKKKDKEIDHIFKTISGSWEFIDYTFFIKDVTRAFTHQLVRQRVGISFAQQSLRMEKDSDYNFLSTGKAENNQLYNEQMDKCFSVYRELIKQDVAPQDARGVLPTNILTNIIMKINLRALNIMMNTRLCVRTAGEFQNCAVNIRQIILSVHPWAEPCLRPFCLEWGVCKFPNYNSCPIKTKYPILNKDELLLESVLRDWEKIAGHSLQPE